MKKKKIAISAKMPFAADVWYMLRRNKGAMFGLIFICIIVLLALFADVIADYSLVTETNPPERLQTPSLEHIFGTDAAGRDLFFRIVHGARYSLAFGIVCTFFSVLAGAVFGATAAFFGGKVDALITFVADAVICLPSTLLSLCLVSVLGPGLRNLMIAIIISYTPSFVRIVRSIVLGITNQEYIEAAKAIGVPSLRNIFVHVLPNAVGMIIINATMNISSLILSAASLSFIGMGIQPPAPEWGAMLNDSLTYLRSYPHIVLFPGLAILLTSLSLNLLGDGLSEALDPRMKD